MTYATKDSCLKKAKWHINAYILLNIHIHKDILTQKVNDLNCKILRVFLKQKVQQHAIKQRDLKAKFIFEHWYGEQSSIILRLASPAKQFLRTSSTLFSW